MLGLSKSWIAFLLINSLMLAVLWYVAKSTPSKAKKLFLPGVTTHGHYQIEMDCNACHTAGMGVQQDACLKCHQAELKQARDTHPASKFRDPTLADKLSVLDATQCITCHREHVEDRTSAMGLTLPDDYCYHCHQETLESRPSHQNLAFNSCSAAGCHNYHDNRALYENFLNKHHGEPDFLDDAVTLVTQRSAEQNEVLPLQSVDADAPEGKMDSEVVAAWSSTLHAQTGVNCKDCHQAAEAVWSEHLGEFEDDSDVELQWQDSVAVGVCAECHGRQAQSFGQGKHGMRLAQNLSPMQPGMARLSMHVDAAHRQLNCNSCHKAHDYSREFAAVEACLECHDDEHSRAFKRSSHFQLWRDERAGELPAGSGVSCATCHLPRIDVNGRIVVQHNQNDNLRPNEKMIRDVCMNCHGLQFSLDSLSDEALVEECFGSTPENTVQSIEMAKAWFDEKERQRQERLKKRAAK